MSGSDELPPIPLEDAIWTMFARATAAEWSEDERRRVATALEAGHRLTARVWTDEEGLEWLSVYLAGAELFRVDVRNFVAPWEYDDEQ